MEKKQILVIEDDEDTNEMICAVLQNEGFRTESAFDGDDGLKKATEGDPDIVILDLMMPRLDGMAVCRALKSDDRKKAIPIIILTAKGGTTDKLNGFFSGASRYLVKPFNLDRLIKVVNTVFEQRHRDLAGNPITISCDENAV